MQYTYEQVQDMSIRQINALFRAQDESHLFPVNKRFNATERAIRRLQRLRRECPIAPGVEYAFALGEEISRIANAC